MQFEQTLEQLLLLARHLTKIGNDTGKDGQAAEQFVADVSEYLDSFEKWAKLAETYNSGGERKSLPQEEQERIKNHVEELGGLHLEVIDLANRFKDEVAEKMGEVYRRAQGMRRYVDRLPQRITIAGKRKG